tara:strand:+ start:7188 stop:7334 length:147 start_codon:yes stop_codon:yes gene_type:complete
MFLTREKPKNLDRPRYRLPPTIVEDVIAGIAFVVICVAGYFLAWGGLT